jgi:hypothetical protein
MIKMTSFLIQTAIFEFKLKTWINQIAPHHYKPPVPLAIGTDPTGFNGGGIACPEWTVAIKTARRATSARAVGRGGTLVGRGFSWIQPNTSI